MIETLTTALVRQGNTIITSGGSGGPGAATLGIIGLFSLRPVTKMFQFTGFPLHKLCIHL